MLILARRGGCDESLFVRVCVQVDSSTDGALQVGSHSSTVGSHSLGLKRCPTKMPASVLPPLLLASRPQCAKHNHVFNASPFFCGSEGCFFFLFFFLTHYLLKNKGKSSLALRMIQTLTSTPGPNPLGGGAVKAPSPRSLQHLPCKAIKIQPQAPP